MVVAAIGQPLDPAEHRKLYEKSFPDEDFGPVHTHLSCGHPYTSTLQVTESGYVCLECLIRTVEEHEDGNKRLVAIVLRSLLEGRRTA